MLALRRHHDGRTLIGDPPCGHDGFLLTARDFAAAVRKLESQLHEPPDERKIAEELRWGYSQPALISLAQEARAAGLVRLCYDASSRTRRYAHA